MRLCASTHGNVGNSRSPASIVAPYRRAQYPDRETVGKVREERWLICSLGSFLSVGPNVAECSGFRLESQPYKSKKLNGIVEADETYVSGKGKHGRGSVKKTPLFSLIERDGRVRSTVVNKVTAKNLKFITRENVNKDSIIMIDEFRSYWGLGK